MAQSAISLEIASSLAIVKSSFGEFLLKFEKRCQQWLIYIYSEGFLGHYEAEIDQVEENNSFIGFSISPTQQGSA